MAESRITPKEEKKIVALETEKYLTLDQRELFHEVSDEAPTGHGVYCMSGFHPRRLVVTYIRGAGFKAVMHLNTEENTLTFTTASPAMVWNKGYKY
ncbi:MAG TPA: hypothetical protein VJJ76_00675 [archaeon]|nr:hypothetical protein [archaeon]